MQRSPTKTAIINPNESSRKLKYKGEGSFRYFIISNKREPKMMGMLIRKE